MIFDFRGAGKVHFWSSVFVTFFTFQEGDKKDLDGHLIYVVPCLKWRRRRPR